MSDGLEAEIGRFGRRRQLYRDIWPLPDPFLRRYYEKICYRKRAHNMDRSELNVPHHEP